MEAPRSAYPRLACGCGKYQYLHKQWGNQVEKSPLEVDFIASRGNQKVYIQSAYRMDDEEKAMQEKRPLLEIRDSFEKIIVVRDSVLPWRDENGILIMGLQDFLEKWDREK